MPATRSPKKGRRTTKTENNSKPAKRVENGTQREWEVEYISEALVRYRRGRNSLYWEYRVKWLGYPHEDDTWEPETSFVAVSESDIVKTFWRDVEACNYCREIPIKKNIMYAGRQAFPSPGWIDAQKSMAEDATDMELPPLPDSRAISPPHEAARQPRARVALTEPERMWQESARQRQDDDPGSHSESEDTGNYGDHRGCYTYTEATPARKRHAEIPDNPQHRKRNAKPPPRDRTPVHMDTPQVLGKRARESGTQPSTSIFVLPNRDTGVLRADKRRRLESHPRGPVSQQPQPILIDYALRQRDAIEGSYGPFSALLDDNNSPEEEDQDYDFAEEDGDGPTFFNSNDAEQALSPLFSEGEIPEEGGNRMPLFCADAVAGMYVQDLPASSPVSTPLAIPTATGVLSSRAPVLAMLGAVANEATYPTMDKDTASSMAGQSITIEELIDTAFLADTWLSSDSGSKHSQSEDSDSVLSSAAPTIANHEAQGGETQGKKHVAMAVDQEIEEGEIQE